MLHSAARFHWSEVEAFARTFYKPLERQGAADHAHMQRHLQPAVDRFAGIEEDDEREKFREKLSGFVRTYAYLSQILPYTDHEQEMLYSFGRFLMPRKITRRPFCNLSRLDPPKRPDDPGVPGLLHGSAWQA